MGEYYFVILYSYIQYSICYQLYFYILIAYVFSSGNVNQIFKFTSGGALIATFGVGKTFNAFNTSKS